LTSLQGEIQELVPAAVSSGQARPGWKILRQLGSELGLAGFDYVELSDIRNELDKQLATDPEIGEVPNLAVGSSEKSWYRLGDVPIYSTDAICRRSAPLQETVHAVNGFVNLNPEDAGSLGLGDGAMAKISQGDSVSELPVRLVAELPRGVVRLPAATSGHGLLGAAFGPISVEAS
jgi:NADH-quinone oxidoreductase subunit G